MRSSKTKPQTAKQDFIQLGLDFFEENQYIIEPLRVEDSMNNDLLAQQPLQQFAQQSRHNLTRKSA